MTEQEMNTQLEAYVRTIKQDQQIINYYKERLDEAFAISDHYRIQVEYYKNGGTNWPL